jgi:cell division septal protein FtsQ
MKKVFLLILIFCSPVFFITNKEEFFFDNYKIKNIQIEVEKNISKLDIESKLNSQNLYNKNLLFLNLNTIINNLSSLELIDNISIKKQFPSNLLIKISERDPKALIINNQETFFIDKTNKITKLSKQSLEKYNNLFKNLLYIEGKDILLEAPSLVDLFVNKDFSKRIYGLYKVNDRRWDLIVDKKIKVMLPERIDKEKIALVFNLVDQMKSKNNIKTNAVYSILDARIKDKVFIKNIDGE